MNSPNAKEAASILREHLMDYEATTRHSADAGREAEALRTAISVLEAETNARPQQTLSDGRIVSIANTLLEEFIVLKHGKPARWQSIADVIRREIARYNGQPDPEPDLAELERQFSECNPQADIGTPEHTRRWKLHDQIFEHHKAAGIWPAESCDKCRGACCQRDYHHIGTCCTHCGNDERRY
jgi:hypothetical protein